MEVSLLEPTMAVLDAQRAEALVQFVFEDVFPLRGTAALLDWRCCGRLSAMRSAGLVSFARDVPVLLAGAPRWRFSKLLFVGLGEQDAASAARYTSALNVCAEVCAKLGVRDPVMSLPGRNEAIAAPQEAVSALFASQVPQVFDNVTLLEPHSLHSTLRNTVEELSRASRARSLARA